MRITPHHTTRNLARRFAGAVTALVVLAGGASLNPSPASAVVSTQWGSGWLTRTAAGSVTSWVSTGAKATLLDVGGGMWKVTFPGITGGFGIPAVSPRNDDLGGSCNVLSWTALSGDATVTFQCMRRDGTLAKTGFSASYTSYPGATEGWAYAQLPDSVDPYTPTLSYDANGGGVLVYRSRVGQYGVIFPGIEVFPSQGAYTANAVGWTDAHCTVDGTAAYPDKTILSVNCAEPDGTPVNVPFVAHLVGSRALLGAPGATAGWAHDRSPSVYGTRTIAAADHYSSNGKAVTVSHSTPGTYTFKFAGLAAASSRMVHATPNYVLDDERCTATSSNSNGAAVVTVKCRDDVGNPVDVPVDMQYEGV